MAQFLLIMNQNYIEKIFVRVYLRHYYQHVTALQGVRWRYGRKKFRNYQD